MLKRLTLAALVLAAAACLWPAHVVRDDGLWPLSVTVASASGAAVASFSAEAFIGKEAARSSLEHLAPPETQITAAVADPFAGEPLAVPIATSSTTHSALLWRSSRFNQMRTLVVIVRYRDGRREGRMVEIPDLRETRSLRVEFP